MAAESDKGVELVFYGSSVFEEFRGTEVGQKNPHYKDGPAIFEKYFRSKHSAQVLAVAGDQTGNLLWRVSNGELATQHPARLAVFMAGTRDFRAAADCAGAEAKQHVLAAAPGVSQRLQATVEHLQRESPGTQVLLLSLLPRGSPYGAFERDFWDWPNAYTPGFDHYAQQMGRLADRLEGVHHLDCGSAFVQGGKLQPKLLPDGLNLSGEGLEALAACIAPQVDSLLASQASRTSGVTAVADVAPHATAGVW